MDVAWQRIADTLIERLDIYNIKIQSQRLPYHSARRVSSAGKRAPVHHTTCMAADFRAAGAHLNAKVTFPARQVQVALMQVSPHPPQDLVASSCDHVMHPPAGSTNSPGVGTHSSGSGKAPEDVV